MEMQIPATLRDKWDPYLAADRFPPWCMANGGAHKGHTRFWVRHTTSGGVEVMQTSKRSASALIKHADVAALW